MTFEEWLELQGCAVEITQETENNGYYCMRVTTPTLQEYDITVTLPE